jgi:hypothetical protein
MIMPQYNESLGTHSPAWVFQTWASFVAAVGTTAAGIAYLPVDRWTQAFFGMGLLFSIGATFNLAKTVRDIHEAGRQVDKLE